MRRLPDAGRAAAYPEMTVGDPGGRPSVQALVQVGVQGAQQARSHGLSEQTTSFFRRIDRDSFSTWMLEQRDKQLASYD